MKKKGPKKGFFSAFKKSQKAPLEISSLDPDSPWVSVYSKDLELPFPLRDISAT